MSWRKPPSLPASATRSTCARYAGHSCIFHCVIGADAASAERLTPSLLVGKCCHWSQRPQHSFAHSPDRPRITSEPGIAEQGPQSHSGGDTPGFPFCLKRGNSCSTRFTYRLLAPTRRACVAHPTGRAHV